MQGSCSEDLAPLKLPRARLTKLTDHRAVRKGQDLQLNYHIGFLQGLLRSESRQGEALSTVWTWADKSSVICVLLPELAREKSAQRINPAPQRLTQRRLPGKCSPAFILCPGRRKLKARTSRGQRRGPKAWDTLCPANPVVVAGAVPAEADSVQHQALEGGQDQLWLGLLLLGLHPFPQRKTSPKHLSQVGEQWRIPPPAPKARQN